MRSNLTLQTDDVGLFIALTTMPFRKEKEFCNKYLAGLFAQEKKYILDNATAYRNNNESSNKYKNLYNPLCYCLWGSFDLAILSLVDDFALSNRKFHPFSHLFPKEKNRGFDFNKSFSYQVTTGVHIRNKNLPTLEAKWGKVTKTMTKGLVKPHLPFLGICSFKVNNALLIGAGVHAIEIVKETIYNQINEIKKNCFSKAKIEFVITNTFTWYELVVVFFTDNVDVIPELVKKCRRINIEDLIMCAQQYEILKFDDTDEQINVTEIIKNITENSFLAKEHGEKLLSSHVFSNTYTQIGFDVTFFTAKTQSEKELYEKKLDAIQKQNNQLKFITTVNAKPGHLRFVVHKLQNLDADYNLKLMLGETDALMEYNGSAKLTVVSYIRLFQNLMNSNGDYLGLHIRKIRTIPVHDRVIENNVPLDIVNDSVNLDKYLFNDKNNLRKIRNDLYKLHVSKIVRERVLKMFINYNDGVKDPVLYLYFLDVSDFLSSLEKRIAELVNEDNESPNEEVHKELLEYADVFEYIYANRFHQSHRMSEITDFNIDFNGGVQQIVSALDTVFKTVFRIINGSEKKHPCLYVLAQPGVVCNSYALRISYFHIFEPVIFLAEVAKEATNYYTQFMDGMERKSLEEYRQELNEFIIKTYKYSHYSYYCQLFINANNNVNDYTLEDIVSYTVGFGCNKELFTFWFWHIYLQDASAYDKDGTINELLFVKICFRYAMLMKLYQENTDNDILAPYPVLQPFWSRHYFKIHAFVTDLLKDDKSPLKYNSNQSSFNAGVLYTKYYRVIEDILHMPSDITRINFFPSIKRYMDNIFIKKKNFSINELLVSGEECTMDSFGNIIRYNQEELQKLLKTYFKPFAGNNYLLKRERRFKKIPDDTNEKYEGLLIDGLGGFFATPVSVRRAYFKSKTKMLYELIHYSLLYKKSQVIDNDSK